MTVTMAMLVIIGDVAISAPNLLSCVNVATQHSFMNLSPASIAAPAPAAHRAETLSHVPEAPLYRPGKNGFVKEQNIRGCGPVSCIYTIEEGEQPRSFTYKQMYKENGPQNLIIIIVSETGPYLNIFNCEAQLNKCTFLSVCLSVRLQN